jgi:hypothetical protein
VQTWGLQLWRYEQHLNEASHWAYWTKRKTERPGFFGHLVGLRSLTATIDPDFDQVEGDPAMLNLTAFETFYPKKRPFFNMEGAGLFNFGTIPCFTCPTRRHSISFAPGGSAARPSSPGQIAGRPADVDPVPHLKRHSWPDTRRRAPACDRVANGASRA